MGNLPSGRTGALRQRHCFFFFLLLLSLSNLSYWPSGRPPRPPQPERFATSSPHGLASGRWMSRSWTGEGDYLAGLTFGVDCGCYELGWKGGATSCGRVVWDSL